MIPRFVGVIHASLLSIAFSTNAYAALATANVLFDWSTFAFSTTGDLAVTMAGPMGDSWNACAQGAPCSTGSTDGFGGVNVLMTGPTSHASVWSTTDEIGASAGAGPGFGVATFERFFSFEALSGSGNLSLSVGIDLQAEVQGAGTTADAEALFGYHVGTSGVLASFADLEMYGDSGDQSQTLSTTLAFSVFMEQGDLIEMFAEGEAAAESVVPVPAAVWLFGSGLLGMIGIARRKKAA